MVISLESTIDTKISMELETLELEGMADIINTWRKFKNLNLNKKGIINYLKESYEIIKYQEPDIKENYLLSLYFHKFGEELLGVDVPNPMTEGFIKLISKLYKIPRPLDIYLIPPNSEEDKLENREQDFQETSKILKRKSFGTDTSASEILTELKGLSGKLNGKNYVYDPQEHLTFNILLLFGAPLVEVAKDKREKFAGLYEKFRDKYGGFAFQIPKYFIRE